MEIKNISGKVLLSVPVTDSAVIIEELMKQYSITLNWDAIENVELPLGAYIEHKNIKYSLLAPYQPQQRDEVTFEYKPEFQHPVMRWQYLPFLFYTYSNDKVVSKEPDWSLTDNAANFMAVLCDVIKEQTGEDWTYEIADNLPASASLSFSNKDIFSALNDIANAFETEWWFDYTNKVLYLSKASHGTEVSLEVGNNISVPSVTQSKEGYYTRFLVFGSTRNIEQEYKGANTNSIVNKRLTLNPAKYPDGYIDIHEGLTNEEILSKTLVFDNIYPRSALTISDVKVRLMWRLDEDKEKIQIGTDADGNPVYDQYAIWYFRIPEFQYKEEYVIPNKPLSIHFNDGPLQGREFELKYHDKAINGLETSDGTSINVAVGDYEIKYIEEGSYIIPSITGLVPADGNKVTLFNILMPEEYKASAYEELENAAQEEIAKQSEDMSNYSFSSNPVEFFTSNPNLTVGQKVTYKNGNYSYNTRVIKLETQLDRPYEQKITIGNEQIKGNTQTLKEEVVNANQNIDLISTINESTQQLVQSYQRTQKALQESMAKWGNMWRLDAENNAVYTPLNMIVEGTLAMGSLGEGGSETPVAGLQKVSITIPNYDNPFVSDAAGNVTLPAYPTALKNPYALKINGVTYDGSKEISVNIEGGGGIADSVAWENVMGRPTKLSEFENDVPYATQKWVTDKGYLTSHQDISHLLSKQDAVTTYATIASLNAISDSVSGLRTEFDALNTLLNDDTSGVIDTWNEVVAFLNGYAESQDLATILSGMNTEIGKRAYQTDLDAAVGRIQAIENAYVNKASDQTITGVKTFQNGLKIGDIKLEWDSTNQALKIIGNAYVTELFSVGKISESGSGGGGAAGIVTVRVNGYDYNSVNGIVTLPDYPSLAGYATESYVTTRGYITASALNGYATQSWVNDNYLSKIGGTLSNSVWANQLNLNAIGTTAGLRFSIDGVLKGILNVDEYQTLRFQGAQEYEIIHSGNIGSYNAGSATKLQTASGTLYASTDGTTYSAFGIRGLVNYFDGIECRINYGSSNTTGFILNSFGNVIVGATNDNNSGAKLQVNGAIDTTTEVKIGGLDVLRRRAEKFCIGEETTIYASQPTSVFGTSISFITADYAEIMRVASSGVDIYNNLTITGTTTTNSLKIGDAELVWDSTNQALKIVGNAYVTKTFSMGELTESGSGGGAASAAVRIMLGETPYDAVNGVVSLPAYPSLAGYATEQWVTNKGYLTSHQDISHLLSKTDAANTYQPKGNYLTSVSWDIVSGKPSFATVATSGKYSDLSGLPTIPTNNNQLTNGAGYITGINSSMVTNALGYTPYNSTNPSGYITSAALNGYAKLTDIPTSLPASDVYSWAKAATKPTYTASEVGALSEGGGIVRGVVTLSGNGVTNVPLNIATPSMGYTGYIRFGAGFDTHELGHLGFSAKGVPAMSYEGVVNTLIHSGNIGSQSVDNATKLGGYDSSRYAFINDIDSSYTYPDAIPLPYGDKQGFQGWHLPGYEYCGIIQWRDFNGNWSQIRQRYGANLYYRGTGATSWREFAFLDSNVASADYASRATYSENATRLYANDYYAYGSSNPYYMQMRYNVLGDNSWYLSVYPETPAEVSVDRARKLVTARSIWGQSFDGQANVEGNLHLGNYYDYEIGVGYSYSDTTRYNRIIFSSGVNGLVYESGRWTSGNVVAHKFNVGLSSVAAMAIMNNSNVLIGATEDNGSRLMIHSSVSPSARPTLGNLKGDIVTIGNSGYYGLHLWNEGSGDGFLQVGRSDGNATAYNLALQPLGGNALIGTTSDNGHKLQVEGSIGLRNNAIFNYGGEGIYIDRGGIYWHGSDNAWAFSFLEFANNGTTKINQWGGNVSIGTISDYGARLQIGGQGLGETSKVLVLEKYIGQTLELVATTEGYYAYNSIISSFPNKGASGCTIHFFAKETAFTEGFANRDSSINLDAGSVTIGSWAEWGVYLDRLGNITAKGNLIVSGNATFGGDVWTEGTMAMAKLASSSDRKLKENIKWLSTDKSMEVVRALRPTEWNWKKDNTHSFGFIAQDVQPIVPEMVSSVNDTLRLEYNQLHAFEIGAIQHIDSEVEQLKRDLKTANNRIKVLENKLKQYELWQ